MNKLAKVVEVGSIVRKWWQTLAPEDGLEKCIFDFFLSAIQAYLGVRRKMIGRKTKEKNKFFKRI